MDPVCLVSTVQAGGGGYIIGGPVNTNHQLNGIVILSNVADYVHLFMATISYASLATSNIIMHHVTKLKSSHLNSVS